ncbi:hypothetical protein KPY62_01595 [Psychrobacter sp. TAE2020]|uniref:hypothetical protein n=1 Tax=Psychrobacter sp. TAE2020 TaxID=2846762 RepID=UPI001C10B758|nr:hypothetical protein [Psychrobacter sp. TAE2020]MBU5615815.1 hypothetical protein [Psychrobacter sp. TAE2020]
MKSSEEVKRLLQNSTMKSDRFFFNNYKIDFSRVGLLNSQIYNGISILKNNEVYIYKVVNSKDQIISTDTPDFYRVQVFLDQYRNTAKPLPTINPSTHPLRNHWYESSEKLKKAMSIMLMPLDSYENFIVNVRLAEETFDRTIIYPEMELGSIATWSLGDTKASDNCITVNSVGNDEWQLLYWERGSSKVILTVFAEKHVYEFFMNEYLNVV